MNRPLFRSLVVVAVLTGAATMAPRPALARHLWIAWDSGTQACMGDTLSWYDCLFHHTTFNAMVSAWPAGLPIADVAGTAVISGCGFNDFQCVVNAGHFTPANDDIVLHFWGSICLRGHNYPDASVVVGGHTIHIHGAEAQTTNICSCQQALGMHELYEAAAMESAADCCNGQNGVREGSMTTSDDCLHPPSSYGGAGWYVYSGCPDHVDYRAQLISPASNWTDVSGCTRLSTGGPCSGVADGTYCGGHTIVGGDASTLYRCAAGASSTVSACPSGCTHATGGHDACSFVGSCTTAFPTSLCADERRAVTISCHNDGTGPWPAAVAIGSDPTDRDSLFADATWPSPRVAVTAGAAVDPGASHDFTFLVHAPTVVAPIAYTQRFAILPQGAPGSAATSPSPDSLAMDVVVSPCAPDAGPAPDRDAAVALDAALDGGGGMHATAGGCCSVPSAARGDGASPLIAGVIGAWVVARRRRAIVRGTR